MRSRKRLIAVLSVSIICFFAYALPAYAVSGLGGAMLAQLGSRSDGGGAMPAIQAGTSFEATVVSKDKLAQLGLQGLQAGDHIQVKVLSGNRLSVTTVPSATHDKGSSAMDTGKPVSSRNT